MRRNAGLLLLALTASCGARSGLRVPDVADASDVQDVQDVIDAFDAPDAPDVVDVVDAPEVLDVFDASDVRDVVGEDVLQCIEGRFVLRRRAAEVVFVLDRSGSMSQPLESGSLLNRWQALRTVLAEALPPWQDAVRMGAFAYPRTADFLDPRSPCRLDPALQVSPMFRAAPAVLQLLDTTTPSGATPTFAALRFVRASFDARPDPLVARSLVLATDGEPNCNEMLDPATCVCTSPVSMGMSCESRASCLDDTRVVNELELQATMGIPTYVIGIDDPAQPRVGQVLDRLAIAGGRPNPAPAATRYYSIRRREDLTRAFEVLTRTIARCVFVTPSRPEDPDMIRVELAGQAVPRDPSHRNGWDWTALTYGEITLFGAACDTAATREVELSAFVTCRE